MMEPELEKAVLGNNRKAMDILANFDSSSTSQQRKSAPEALNKLKEAISLLEGFTNKTDPTFKRLMAITLNNIACYYKRFNKPNVALQYLTTVLDLEESLKEPDISTARTHLNICAIESSLNRHKVALSHAQKALNIAIKVYEATKAKKDPEVENIGATLAIAFYNVGAELEHLRYYKEAHFACKHGLEICTGALGSKHVLCEKLQEFIWAIEKYKDVQEQQQNTIKLMRIRPRGKNRQKTAERIRFWKSPYKCYKEKSEVFRSKTSSNAQIKRAISVFRRKEDSPEKTANVLAKKLVLPEIKTPADKYYDYKVSQLMKKPKLNFTQDAERSLRSLGISLTGEEEGKELLVKKKVDMKIKLKDRRNTSMSTRSDEYQISIPHNKNFHNKLGNLSIKPKRPTLSSLNLSNKFPSYTATAQTPIKGTLELREDPPAKTDKLEPPKVEEQKKSEDEAETVNYGEKYEAINEKIQSLQTNLKNFENSIKEIKAEEILNSETRNKESIQSIEKVEPVLEPDESILKASLEFRETRQKIVHKKVKVRDSHPCEDFEENNENAAEVAKQFAEEVLFKGVKKIIRAIRNYIFRKKINERIKEKKRIASLEKKMIENTGVIPTGPKPKVSPLILKRHQIPLSGGSAGGLQNRIKEKARRMTVRNAYAKLYNKEVLLWARKVKALTQHK